MIRTRSLLTQTVGRVAAAASLAFAFLPAVASEPEADETRLARYLVTPLFDTLDCGNEGYIEAGEVDEHFPSLFNLHDRNLDSSLSRAEFIRAGEPDGARMEALLFAGMDSDGDDAVSTMEYRTALIRMIQSLDGDGDGEVSEKELAAGRK